MLEALGHKLCFKFGQESVSNLCATWRHAELKEVCLESLTPLAKREATADGLFFHQGFPSCFFFKFFSPQKYGFGS